jgi:hypothetical protein
MFASGAVVLEFSFLEVLLPTKKLPCDARISGPSR